METHNIKIGNRIFQLKAIVRAEYATKNAEIKATMNATSYLHVYTVDGKDFTLLNQAADLLWEALCDSALELVREI